MGKSGDLGEHRQHEENLYLKEGSRQQKVLYLNVNCKLKKVTHEEVRRTPSTGGAPGVQQLLR